MFLCVGHVGLRDLYILMHLYEYRMSGCHVYNYMCIYIYVHIYDIHMHVIISDNGTFSGPCGNEQCELEEYRIRLND